MKFWIRISLAIRIQADEILFLKERLNIELADRTGQELSKVKEDTDRDFYMSPQEAVEYGLIDLVLNKKPVAGSWINLTTEVF